MTNHVECLACREQFKIWEAGKDSRSAFDAGNSAVRFLEKHSDHPLRYGATDTMHITNKEFEPGLLGLIRRKGSNPPAPSGPKPAPPPNPPMAYHKIDAMAWRKKEYKSEWST